jgi:hypothetical protein
MKCQTAHPRDFFGERDGAACGWTDSFIDVKAVDVSPEHRWWVEVTMPRACDADRASRARL